MAFINRMKAQDYIDNSRKYLDYLEEHIENVRLAFIEVSNACEGMAWVGDDYSWHTVRIDVEHHDLSKFSKEEFVQYRDNFFPVTEKDKTDSGFCCAWTNHKNKNHHHYETAETWCDVIHMIIDWTAMGYKFGDTAQNYYEAHQGEMLFTDEQLDFMYEVFSKIELYKKED
jgi:hypothetical protein